MSIDKYQKEDFFKTLSENRELQKVIKSIEYSAGHNVDMLNISSVLTLNLALEYIENELQVLGEAKELVVLSFKDGLEAFFKKLEYFYTQEGNYLFVFDFLALSEVSEAEYVFTMVNKERNLILERLNSPILLIVPKGLKKVFAYGASDFWSVKKYSVSIEEFQEKKELESSEPLNIWQKLMDFTKEKLFNKKKSKALIGKSAKASGYLEEIKLLEKELKKDKENFRLQRLLLVAEAELGDYYKKYEDIKDAFEAYVKAVSIAQNIENKRPDSIEAKRDLSVSLDKVADIYLQKGDVEKSLKYYQESLVLRENIENKRPDSIEAKRDLSVSYYKISMLFKEQKKFEESLEQLLKARALILPFKNFSHGDFDNMLRIFEQHIEEMR